MKRFHIHVSVGSAGGVLRTEGEEGAQGRTLRLLCI
jgi:hypothetical protein